MKARRLRDDPPSALALAQGGFYLATGLWPLLHLRSFEKVTGPKPEGWLVKTIGALITVVGVALVRAGARRRVSSDLRLVATGSALALSTADLIYASKRRISPVYLADVPPEWAIIAGWVKLRRRPRSA